ncbi:MAG: hypothetical protein IPK59_22330 [Rhodospirillaceae bacterium]|nr:hypothetical protein [Rhodospirillaceae bacterium]
MTMEMLVQIGTDLPNLGSMTIRLSHILCLEHQPANALTAQAQALSPAS